MNVQRGFVSLGILLAIILGVVVIGGGAYYVVQQNVASRTAPDGNLDSLQELPTGNGAVTVLQEKSAVLSGDSTANWKTYRSDVWGIEFKYPSNFILHTTPPEFWKDFNPYQRGDNFFELIDSKSNCYIGPVKAVDLGYASSRASSIRLSTGNAVEVKYWTSSDGGVLFGLTNYNIPNTEYQLPLNVTSLSADLIVSNYKKSENHSIPNSCVKDFERILATLKLLKPAQTNAVPVGWKSYENKEVGIAFEYPESWGEISVNRQKGCAYDDVQYYGAATSSLIKAKLDATGDPCLHVMFSAGGNSFLATQSSLYAEYPVPRDGYWGDGASSIKSDDDITTYCDTHAWIGTNCRLFTTKSGVRIVSYQVDGCEGMGCAPGLHYLIKSSKRYYLGVALYARKGSPMNSDDFSKLVDSLRFF